MLRIQRAIIIKWGWRDGQMLRHSGKLEPVFLLGIRMAVPDIYIYIDCSKLLLVEASVLPSWYPYINEGFLLRLSWRYLERRERSSYNTKSLIICELPLWWSSSPMTELRERADSMRNAMTWRWPFSQVRVCK
jgi:hypothetical protein